MPPRPRRGGASRGHEALDRGRFGRAVLVGLAALGTGDQRRRRLEALAVAPGELAGPRGEAGDPALVAIDVREPPAAPSREADAQDGADVAVGDRLDDALVEALDRLDGLGE